jgi:hypothetical protein
MLMQDPPHFLDCFRAARNAKFFMTRQFSSAGSAPALSDLTVSQGVPVVYQGAMEALIESAIDNQGLRQGSGLVTIRAAQHHAT